MTPLIRRSITVAASTAFMTFALSGVIPLSEAQEAGAVKSPVQRKVLKKSAGKAESVDSSKKAAPADDEEGEEEEAAKPKAKGARKAPPDVTHRVPSYFGGLDLTEQQKEAIYKLEAKYQPQIQELQKKTESLRERLMTDCEDVLTAPQKKALADARKAGSERRKAASKAREKADE